MYLLLHFSFGSAFFFFPPSDTFPTLPANQANPSQPKPTQPQEHPMELMHQMMNLQFVLLLCGISPLVSRMGFVFILTFKKDTGIPVLVTLGSFYSQW